jgi:four helix bundle protein
MAFKKLRVWQEAHYLALEVYRVTKEFPESEAEGLTAEMRASAIKISGKIARAAGVPDAEDRNRSLKIALRNARELKLRVEIASTLEYLEADRAKELDFQIQRVEYMLTKLLLKIRVGR